MQYRSDRGEIWFNSLAPGKFEWNFRHVIFKQILVMNGWGISCKIALIWMSLGFTDDQSTLVQVMAWCHQATSHYLSQCWPRSISPHGLTRPQWVNSLAPGSCGDVHQIKTWYLSGKLSFNNDEKWRKSTDGREITLTLCSLIMAS